MNQDPITQSPSWSVAMVLMGVILGLCAALLLDARAAKWQLRVTIDEQGRVQQIKNGTQYEIDVSGLTVRTRKP